jgi:hypothetical protein
MTPAALASVLRRIKWRVACGRDHAHASADCYEPRYADPDTTAALAALEGEGARHQACPCLHIEPCDPHCTCVNPYSSRGCTRCCSYGSKEQQRAAAEHLAAQTALIGRLRKELRAVLAQYVDSDHREYEEPYWGARAESARALLAEREAP